MERASSILKGAEIAYYIIGHGWKNHNQDRPQSLDTFEDVQAFKWKVNQVDYGYPRLRYSNRILLR